MDDYNWESLDAEDSTLVSDCVPGDFFNNPHNKFLQQPEVCLMIAVLRDGIATYINLSTDPGSVIAQKEADEWMSSRDSEWLYSFENMCFTLGIDSEALRSSLRRERSSRAAAGWGSRIGRPPGLGKPPVPTSSLEPTVPPALQPLPENLSPEPLSILGDI